MVDREIGASRKGQEMQIVVTPIYEILKVFGKAYITPDDLFYRNHQFNVWIDLQCEPGASGDIVIKYADIPGIKLEFLTETAIAQANKQILDFKKTCLWDLVGYHLETRPGSMLPVVAATYKKDDILHKLARSER